MPQTPFRLVDRHRDTPLADTALLRERPFTELKTSFAEEAHLFVPGERLENALNTALAVGDPLLVTGEPGTGKTQAAYWLAHHLGIAPVRHFQVKSESTARDLLYHFDTVRYFHDAHLEDKDTLDKQDYVEERALWQAMRDAEASGAPRVLLIDEIDKAPRDFPNDLLHELDQMEFTIAETGKTIRAPGALRPIVVITSNSERRLPEPFLRRCVYHHIHFDDKILQAAVEKRREHFKGLSDELLELAIRRFLDLRERALRKKPATGELLVWLRVLALAIGTYPPRLDKDLSKLPYLGALLKDHQDIEELGGSSA